MNVRELREALADLPDWYEVTVLNEVEFPLAAVYVEQRADEVFMVLSS